MTFAKLSKFFDEIEEVSSRLEMTDILARLFSDASSEESAIVCYLLTGRVAPMFIPIEFNVAEKTLLNVLDAYARSLSDKGRPVDVGKMYSKLGDLGLIAQELLEKRSGKSQKSKIKASRITKIYELLWEIASVSGTGSVEIRNKKIFNLLEMSSPLEAKFLVRILSEKLRLGCSAKTVLDALSVCAKGDKTDRDDIERAYGVCSDLGYVASVYLDGGLKGLKKVKLTPGVPAFPMLVQREKDAETIIKRIPDAIVQAKYDGLRCQIHIGVEEEKMYSGRIWGEYWDELDEIDGGQQGLFASQSGDHQSGGKQKAQKVVRLFSRNLEDMTEMFPEIVKAAEVLDVKSAIFDAEVIGYNEAAQEFVKFQETMMRKRKYGVKGAVERIPVKVFVFDVLYLNGDSKLDENNDKRIEIVDAALAAGRSKEGKRKKPTAKDKIVPASNVRVKTASELSKAFDKSVSEGLEGVIIKDPKSKYQVGVRGFDWIKLKRASQGHLADTVDLVILGYYFGRGRQVHFGMGALLGAVYDAKKDKYVTLAKIGTGITDEQWATIKKDLDEIKVPEKPAMADVDKALIPDQWVEPKIVVTVEADEITKSPVHTAGRDRNGVGYALRFPRLKVWGRDRSPEDATRVKEVLDMYGHQG